jgi:adenylylsulfate kinase
MNILIFGLPGSGKSIFARKLIAEKKIAYLNADEVRKMFNDWDFTEAGRIRQAQRMIGLTAYAQGHCVVDFVCPYDNWRDDYDIKIWMNTIQEGRFEDTNKIFEKPTKVDYEIKNFDYDHIITDIKQKAKNFF